MKITYSKKKSSESPKRTTVLIFKEKTKNHLKEYENGSKELIIEVAKESEISLQNWIYTLRSVIRTAKNLEILDLGISFKDVKQITKKVKIDEKKAGEIFATNVLMADFSFDQNKSKKENREKSIKNITIFGDVTQKFKDGAKRGLVIGKELNKARHLCNTPGTDLLPSALVKKAKEAVKGLNIKLTILDKKRITSLKMGGVLGVSRGASDGPFVITMEYKGAGKNKKPIALVGKGVTFDTGGVNIKPGTASSGMHMDMSGGGAVIHTVVLAAKLKIPINLVAVVPVVENVISGKSYKPGDFIKSMSGKTIEVTHTDAEGRLILADALFYAKRFKPSTVIDVATLTGASIIALGNKYSAIFSTDEKLQKSLVEAGTKSGERVWPMPMGPEYQNEMLGTFTDLVNANLSNSLAGGVSTSAAFLKEFVEYTNCWAHIDIAPRMESSKHDNLAKGSIGAPMLLLIEYLKK